MSITTETYSLIDNPITSAEQDSLELDGFARALGQFIDSCDTPVTIGVQGDWGIGKTSLLNLVRQHLSPRRGRRHRTPTIYLNTWQYAQFRQEEWLGILILNGIIDQIEAEFPEQSAEGASALRDVASLLGKFALGATNQFVASKTGIDVSAGIDRAADGSESGHPRMSALLTEYRTRFASLVSAVVPGEQDRLVIMIDDLDRVTPLRALEILDAIKNFLDVPGCVFVLAVDYAVIQQGVAQRLGEEARLLHGKSYFDKIIQVPFNMPTTAYRLDRYILRLLGWEKSETGIASCGEQPFLPAPTSESPEHVDFFTNITSLSVGNNPRSIKRVTAYVRLLRLVRDRSAQSRRGESGNRWDLQSAKTLYALACMQIEWPELFMHFVAHPSPGMLSRYESWEFVSSLSEVQSMLPRYPDQEQAKTNITAFFDEFTSLVDSDGSGEISVEEFRPVWDIMRDAGLTSLDLPSTGTLWKPLEELLAGTGASGDAIESFCDLLKASRWNNPMHCRVLPAGKRFVNLLWDGRAIGSFVSTKKDPLRWFMLINDDIIGSDQFKRVEGLLELATESHYGIGNFQVAIERLIDTTDSRQSMTALLGLIDSASGGIRAPARMEL